MHCVISCIIVEAMSRKCSGASIVRANERLESPVLTEVHQSYEVNAALVKCCDTKYNECVRIGNNLLLLLVIVGSFFVINISSKAPYFRFLLRAEGAEIQDILRGEFHPFYRLDKLSFLLRAQKL